ncbi:hypothetical protein ACULNC_16865 [Shigella flexneri]
MPAGRPSIDLLRALILGTAAWRERKTANIDTTWQALSSMTQEQANTLVINTDENILQGWLNIAARLRLITVTIPT